MKEKLIPATAPISKWESVPIKESDEPLVSLRSLGNKRICVVPKLSLFEVPNALQDVYVRKGVAERLEKALTILKNPQDLFIVWDGWRPPEIQQALFDLFYEKFKKDFPFLTEPDLLRYVQVYVSQPSQDPTQPHPHSTGGAIDLTIGNKDKNTLYMGTSFMQISPLNKTRSYETKKKLNTNEKIALENRRLLYHVLTSAGFTNYEEAWWHFDYGNQWWAVKKKQDALYGIAHVERKMYDEKIEK